MATGALFLKWMSKNRRLRGAAAHAAQTCANCTMRNTRASSNKYVFGTNDGRTGIPSFDDCGILKRHDGGIRMDPNDTPARAGRSQS